MELAREVYGLARDGFCSTYSRSLCARVFARTIGELAREGFCSIWGEVRMGELLRELLCELLRELSRVIARGLWVGSIGTYRKSATYKEKGAT